jgi:hypothetical protein
LPVEVEAYEWTGDLDAIPAEWRAAEAIAVEPETGDLIVPTEQGPSHAKLGWTVIKGTEGELYPISPQVRAAKYEVLAP